MPDQHGPPRDLIVRRIGRMHIMPFARKSYIETYGKPRTKEELTQRHRIVLMYADQGRANRYYNEIFPDHPQAGFLAMRTDVSTALYAAIANGVAVGGLPAYCF